MGENGSGTRRSSVSSTLQLLSGRLSNVNIKLIKYADDITIYTSGPVVSDLINGLNIYLSQVLKDINNGQIYSNTFHAGYSRAPLTSTSEVGRPSTTARKEAKGVRSDDRHPSHSHTTLQQYRSKSAATQ